MDNIYVYVIRLPDGIKEIVMPCADGYTVYLDNRLTREQQQENFLHAVGHIENGDFDRQDVQEIEADAHRRAHD